jgi:hypothetical protein
VFFFFKSKINKKQHLQFYIMHPALRYSYKVVDRVAPLKHLSEKFLSVIHEAKSQQNQQISTTNNVFSPPPLLNVACDVEALVNPLQANQVKHLGDISLIQLCCPEVDNESVNIVDVLSIGNETVKETLKPIMESKEIRKIMFDCRRDVEALSVQLQLRPQRILDLQLVHTAHQWKMKASDRRSGLQFVLKQELGVDRAAGDAAVSKAMLHGNRPVWDVRPLPEHFLEYAADDVRHLYALYETMKIRHENIMDSAERISEEYTRFYSVNMKYVEEDADVKSQTVRTDWLERYFGPAGVCGFCGARGHHEENCFKKHQAAASENSNNTNNANQTTTTTTTSSSANVTTNPHQPTETATKTILRCGYCGSLGHLSTNCFKKHPQLLKCKHCGQMGHTETHCFVKNPCEFCGGKHKTDKCLKKQMAEKQQN